MPNKVVTSDLAAEVWSRLDSKQNKLDISEDLGLSERTIQRLSAAQSKFEAGSPRGEISRATGWALGTISELGEYWDRFQQTRVHCRLTSEELQGRQIEGMEQREESRLIVDVGSLSHQKRPGVFDSYSSAWTLEIALTNPSRELPVGVKGFVLDVTRGDEGHILHHVGKDTYGSNEEVPFPELALDNSLRIEPVTTVRGKLRFLDRCPFGPNEGDVSLTLTVEESDGQRHTYGLGDMNL